MTQNITYREATKLWLRIALLSFGGPVGQIAVVQRIIVDEHKLITPERFLRALNYCMLLPGPEAQQLVTYIGWLLHGTRGGLTAGLLFILPGFLCILALSLAYLSLADTQMLQAAFVGIKASVLAIIVSAMLRISNKILHNARLIAIAVAAFVGIFAFGLPFPIIIVLGGCIGVIHHFFFTHVDTTSTTSTPPSDPLSWRASIKTASIWLAIWLVPVGLVIFVFGPNHVFSQISIFFSKLAMVTFGGAYAVLAYMAQAAVNDFGWLQPEQMLDGLAMAESTPGPLIQVVQFVAFMAASANAGEFGVLPASLFASLLATWVTFAPCFLWIFVGAPYCEYLQNIKAINAALTTITACVVGVIANLVLWFAIHVLFQTHAEFREFGLNITYAHLNSIDLGVLAISVMASAILITKRAGVLPVLGLGILAGLVIG